MKQLVLRAVVVAALVPAGMVVTGLGSVAHASTSVRIHGDDLIVVAAVGAANNVTVTTVGDRMIVRDSGDVVPAIAPCTAIDPNAVSCPGPGIVTTVVDLLDRDDKVFFNAPRPGSVPTSHVILRGGPGTDLLQLGGLSPAGELFGGPGGDTLRGGTRDDILDGGGGADGLLGGAGVDRVTYEDRTKPITADIDGVNNDDGEADERDTIGLDVESIVGGSQGDTLIGSAGDDILFGGPGNDSLFGRGGDDELVELSGSNLLAGEEGDDLFRGSGPGGGDTMLGGIGDDTFLPGRETRTDMNGGPGPSGTDTDSDVFFGSTSAVVLYTDRVRPVNVSLDDLANDGEVGENDLVKLSVPVVRGGMANDSLTSFLNDGMVRVFDGGPGNDHIDMRNGHGGDRLVGGDGPFDNCPFEQGDLRLECEGSVG